MSREVHGKEEVNLESLRRIINREICRIGHVTDADIADDCDLSDLGIDSLGKLELIAVMETSFSVSISDAEAFEVKTAVDLQTLVLSHVS